MPAITTVIFDVGNVLYDWHPRFLFEKLISDPEELEHFLSEVLTLDWHFQHDAGRNFADTSAELIGQFPHYENYILQFAKRFNETNRAAITGTHEILRELDQRKTPLFAITNFSHEFFPPFRTLHAEIFDRFRDIIVSGTEKMMKPDPAIYALALRRFGLQPGEAIFIDDNLANVEAARANGFAGHHFIDAETLRAELAALDLLN